MKGSERIARTLTATKPGDQRRPNKDDLSQHFKNQWFVVISWTAALLSSCSLFMPPGYVPRMPAPPVPSGGELFQSYCAACHQYDGQGVGEAPPLDNSPWVVGPAERLIKIALHGVRGKMEIQGKTYNREMPGFGQILSDEDTATLLSFVRSRFGAPEEPISAAMVHQVRTANEGRTDYWTVEELLNAP